MSKVDSIIVKNEKKDKTTGHVHCQKPTDNYIPPAAL